MRRKDGWGEQASCPSAVTLGQEVSGSSGQFAGLVISALCVALLHAYGWKTARRWFLPELSLFLTAQDGNVAYSGACANWQTRLWRVFLGACALTALLAVGDRYSRALGDLPYAVQGVPWYVLLVAVVVVGPVFLSRENIRHRLRRDLVNRGIAVCMACGYDLRGQREPRCPECGTPFDAKLLGESTKSTNVPGSDVSP